MKYAEIRNLHEQELRKRLAESRQALFDSRMKHKMQRLSNIMDLRNFKRDISQIETALTIITKAKPPAVRKEKEKEELSHKVQRKTLAPSESQICWA